MQWDNDFFMSCFLIDILGLNKESHFGVQFKKHSSYRLNSLFDHSFDTLLHISLCLLYSTFQFINCTFFYVNIAFIIFFNKSIIFLHP